MAETIAMKHRLIDLQAEVNVERDEALKAAKSIYNAVKIEEMGNYTANLASIKAEFRDMYKERKAVIVTENEEA